MKWAVWVKALLALVILLVLFVGISLGMILMQKDIPAPDVSDLQPTRLPVPEENNAYPLLREMAGLVVKDEEQVIQAWMEGEGREQDLLELFAANELAMAQLQDALAREGYWHEPEYSFEMMMPELNGWLNLAKIMQGRICWLRERGQLNEAVLLTIDLERFGVKVAEDGAVAIAHLAGLTISELALQEMRELIRHPDISVEMLQMLNRRLLEPAKIKAGAVNALKGEAQVVHTTALKAMSSPEYLDSLVLGTSSGSHLPIMGNFVFQPNRTISLYADETRAAIQFMDDPRIPLDEFNTEGIQSWVDLEEYRRMIRPNNHGMNFVVFMTSSLRHICDRAIQHIISRDATRLVALLRLSEIEQGRLPTSLDELVPEYAESVGLDPFSARPYLYDSERALLWSIGRDRKDQGGSARLIRSRPKPTELDAEDQLYSVRKTMLELLEEP